MKHTLIGKSKAINKINKQINSLAAKNDDIIIIGERGCGKTFIAKNIHYIRAHGNERLPLIELKLSKFNEKELEDVLCDIRPDMPATVLFDEIDNTSQRTQHIILKFLHRINEYRSCKDQIPVDVRVIMTTKDEPAKLRENGRMPDELANQLAEFVSLLVPPLRFRKEDIPYLVEHFIVETSKNIGIQEPVIDINAISILVDQTWKDNIHELKSVIERSVLFSTNGMFLLPQELIDSEVKVTRMLTSILTGRSDEFSGSLDTIERGLLESVLERFDYFIPEAAKSLGMNEHSLKLRAVKLGLVNADKL